MSGTVHLDRERASFKAQQKQKMIAATTLALNQKMIARLKDRVSEIETRNQKLGTLRCDSPLDFGETIGRWKMQTENNEEMPAIAQQGIHLQQADSNDSNLNLSSFIIPGVSISKSDESDSKLQETLLTPKSLPNTEISEASIGSNCRTRNEELVNASIELHEDKATADDKVVKLAKKPHRKKTKKKKVALLA